VEGLTGRLSYRRTGTPPALVSTAHPRRRSSGIAHSTTWSGGSPAEVLRALSSKPTLRGARFGAGGHFLPRGARPPRAAPASCDTRAAARNVSSARAQ
jgi:hypothetical protein